MISISDCPFTGLTRKIEYRDLYKLESTRQVILRCHFAYFKPNGDRVVNQPMKPYCDLVASDSLCDPQTGRLWSTQEIADYNRIMESISEWNKLPEETRGNQPAIPLITPVTEFEFFMALTMVPIKMDDMERSYIAQRDAEGKLNK